MKKSNFIETIILLFVLNFGVIINAQDSSQTIDFSIGAFISRYPVTGIFDSFDSTGMNTVVFRADNNTLSNIGNYNVIANNADANTDWIQHYATGYYSKWEAEENQTDTTTIGVKHKSGQQATWKDTVCWSNVGLSAPACSLMYGPHYRQEKLYKRWLYGNRFDVDYTARFRMALNYDTSLVSEEENVCVIKVVYRYAKIYDGTQELVDEIFVQDTLLVSDFRSDGFFDYFTLSNYEYDPKFGDDMLEGKVQQPAGDDTLYTDSFGNNGIQFWVDWLREDTLCTLYIDYAEVYDNDGWNFYILDPDEVKTQIQTYTQSYSTPSWNNLKYWFAHDEPYTIDAYTPMSIVNTIVMDSAGGAPLITEFYPDWRILVNNDSQLVRYYNMVQPEKLMIDMYPFSPATDPPLWKRFESLRTQFTIAHSLQPGFWYVGQGFGIWHDNGYWQTWRYPDSTELKASVMLALAHGIKGLMFWNYDSYEGDSTFVVGIDSSLHKKDLWYLIKNNFVPRLKGIMGKKLLSLNYTGNFLQVRYFTPSNNPAPQAQVYDYLTLGAIPSTTDQDWHAGLFEIPTFIDDKYFMLVNLLPNLDRNTYVKVTPPVTGYSNYRFKNVDAGFFDTTFTTQISYRLDHTKGEGHLYQVAPVLKYGGKLITNDTVNTDINLMDNMIIRNGATITIEDGKKYATLDTITLEGTGFISGDGYFDREGNGWVILDSWDYSVFKGRKGDHPKVIWSEHPSIQNVHSYRIYRDKGTSGWVPIKVVENNVFEYIDSTVTIITGPPQGNELSAYYFVAVRVEENDEIINADSSNTILYRRVEGAGWEKRGTGKTGEVYTYSLNQNYPNPFNPSTTIEYCLERDGYVEIEIMDILGRRILQLVNDHKQKGNHTVVFNASNLSSGMYLYRMKSGKFVSTKKMILLK